MARPWLSLVVVLIVSVLVVGGTDAQDEQEKPKTVLFLAAYQKSPIISLQGLAEEMHNRGYRVLFTATDDDRHLITSESVGVEFLSAGPPPKDPPMALTIEELFTGEAMYARAMYDYLLPRLRNETIDLVVYEPLSLAGEAIAHTLNVPVVQVIPHLSTLAWLGSEETTGHPVIISGMASSTMGTLERLKNTILRFVAGWVLPVVKGSLVNDFRRHAGLEEEWFACQNRFGRTQLAILASAPFEPPRSFPPLIQNTGPFLPRSSPIRNDREKKVVEWLEAGKDSERPLVFVSIGTNSDHTTESANAILEALLKGAVEGSRFRAIWSLKDKHRHLLDAALLKRYESATEEDKNNLLITSFAPQLLVLEHASVFLSHCGLASLQESLFYGVPLLCSPMMLESDQPTNAARVEELGVGLWLNRKEKELTAGDVSDNLNALLSQGHPTRSQAQRFKGIMRKMDGRSLAADWLEMAMQPLGVVELLQPLPSYNWDMWAVGLTAVLFVYLLLGALRRCCCGRSNANKKLKVQ